MKELRFVSDRLIDEIRRSSVPLGVQAVRFKISPALLSRIINKREAVTLNDKRVLKIARFYKVPAEEAFERFEIVKN